MGSGIRSTRRNRETESRGKSSGSYQSESRHGAGGGRRSLQVRRTSWQESGEQEAGQGRRQAGEEAAGRETGWRDCHSALVGPGMVLQCCTSVYSQLQRAFT